MSRLSTIGFLASLTLATAVGQAAVTFDWATVGNAGNAADPLNSGLVPGIGSVGYSYSISKYETTNAQYVEFLNAADAGGTNTRALYNSGMSTDGNSAGISFAAGNASGSKYGVLSGQGNKPVTYVSWYDAARMANWLHNGQGAGSTETGVYTLTSNTSISGGRSANATFAIPTENEWYKAAYHQPAAAGGDADSYWLYPTGTNTEPNSDQPPGAGSINQNVGNFSRDDGLVNGFNDGFAVTGSTSYSVSQNYLTNAGAYTLADSYYGTFDQGGNVFEWNETRVTGSSGGLRGGSWYDNSLYLRSGLVRYVYDPSFEDNNIGFRLASIPEPASLLSVALVGMVALNRRRRR